MSAGEIAPSTTNKTYIGGIVGDDESDASSFIHCFWTSDVGHDNLNGTGSPSITDSVLIGTMNSTTIEELNEYAENIDDTWSRWVMLHLNGGSINTLGQEAPIGGLLKSLPVPVKKGHTFLPWCTDEECSEQYDPQTTDVSGVTDLYAHWVINNYTVTFDGNGGTPSKESIVVAYNSAYGDLPSSIKEGHSFLGWFTEYNEEIKSETTFTIARDQTLYAHWEVNTYTITFIFNNGTETNSVFQFNASIIYPEEITREGFIFSGWLPNPERMPAENITIRAQWNITNPSEYVEIVFEKKDLSEEEIKEIIKKYVPEGEEFTIAKFVEDESGEMRVVIKFADKEKASEFIRSVDEHKRPEDGISHVRAVTEYEISLIHPIYPIMSFLLTIF